MTYGEKKRKAVRELNENMARRMSAEEVQRRNRKLVEADLSDIWSILRWDLKHYPLEVVEEPKKMEQKNETLF